MSWPVVPTLDVEGRSEDGPVGANALEEGRRVPPSVAGDIERPLRDSNTDITNVRSSANANADTDFLSSGNTHAPTTALTALTAANNSSASASTNTSANSRRKASHYQAEAVVDHPAPADAHAPTSPSLLRAPRGSFSSNANNEPSRSWSRAG